MRIISFIGCSLFLFLVLYTLIIQFGCIKSQNKKIPVFSRYQVDSLTKGNSMSRKCFQNISLKYASIQHSFICKSEVLNDTENNDIQFICDTVNNVLIATKQVTFGYDQETYVFDLNRDSLSEINGIALTYFAFEKNILVEKDDNNNDGLGRIYKYSLVDYKGKKIMSMGSCPAY